MKKTTIDSKAKLVTMDAQTRENLNVQLSILKAKGTTAHNADIARATALLKIREEKLYIVDGKETFKEWFEVVHSGEIYGIGYKQACQLISAAQYVWNSKELKAFPLTSATRLASVCKSEDGKNAVLELVKNGKIKSNMSYRNIDDILKNEGLKKDKKAESAPSPKISDAQNEELLEAVARVNDFMKKLEKANAKKSICADFSKVMDAWNIIKDATKEL